MTRVLGLLAIFGATFFAARCYGDAEQRRVAEAEGLLSLLIHLRLTLGTYALPLADIYASFQNEALERAGFLPTLRQEGMQAALTAAAPMGLGQEELSPLLQFAAQLGRHFLEDELRAADRVIAHLSAVVEERRRDAPRRKKLGRALFATGGAMIALLFI